MFSPSPFSPDLLTGLGQYPFRKLRPIKNLRLGRWQRVGRSAARAKEPAVEHYLPIDRSELLALSPWVDQMLIVTVHDPGLPIPQRQDGIGQWQPGCDQRRVLGNIMRREEEGNQAQACEIRKTDLVAVPIWAPAGNADLRTSHD